MNKIVITGNSGEAVTRVEKEFLGACNLKYVTVFFENANFLITRYEPANNGIYLILELEDGTEIHIEGGNCGYGGGGPSATVKILEVFGLNGKEVENLIFYNDAVRFEVSKQRILYHTIDTSFLFYPQIREECQNMRMLNQIRIDRNVDVDLEKKKVVVYNPQRNCWNGLMNLLSYMEDITFEYYIGENSPLEGGLCIGKDFRQMWMGKNRPDVKGITHVNLLLSGSNFSVVCWIDRKEELSVIEAVYLSLTGKGLFEEFQSDFTFIDCCRKILGAIRNHQGERYGKEYIEKRQLKRRLV